MRPIVIAMLALLLPASVSAGELSGHWQNASGHRFFLHQQAGGRVDVWLPMSGRQVAFEPGRMTVLAPADRTLPAALCEINAPSRETLIVGQGGRFCEVKDLRFSILGLLFRSGYRGRNMEFRGLGIASGTMVCGKQESPWSATYTGSWKRL